MEQIGNRISFVKSYTKAEKIAINTKIDRILKELSDMQLGPCSFKLSEEITCICYRDRTCSKYLNGPDYELALSFKFRDDDERDTYSAKSLFITEYERRLRQDLLNARKVFDLDEKSVFDITYTRVDGIDTILTAKKAGVDIDLTPYLELPDLTENEIESLVKAGYGYDMYLKEGVSETIKSYISYALTDNFFFIYKDDMHILYDWIEKNPAKCLLPENRHPEKTEDMQEEEEKEM